MSRATKRRRSDVRQAQAFFDIEVKTAGCLTNKLRQHRRILRNLILLKPAIADRVGEEIITPWGSKAKARKPYGQA